MITTQFYIFTAQDDLVFRRMKLEQMIDIPNMRDYAAAWLCLAREFRSCGLRINAEYCKSRGRHYAHLSAQAGMARKQAGAYRRKIEQPFAEMIPFQDMTESEKQFISEVWVG